MRHQIKRLLIIVALLVCFTVPAFGTENGNIAYPIGVNTVLSGILPPPGKTQFFNYMQFYTAERVNDSDGEKMFEDFSLDVFVEALRFVHSWNHVFGSFYISSGLVVPLVHMDLDIDLGSPYGFPLKLSDDANNLGDITLQPLNINYSNKSHTFFAYFATDLVIPTGKYSEDDVANTGNNYYAFQPQVCLTWFPSRKWEVSGAAMVEFKSENDATNYQSGDVATLEYNVGYMITEKLQLGLQGYFLSQFTDDEIDGSKVDDGHRAKANAIGPQLRYDMIPGGGLVLKWQHEYSVENRPQGDKIWLQFTMGF